MKEKKRIKRAKLLAVDQVEQLIAAAGAERHGVRDRAIIGLLWAGGLRVGELVSLDVEDVDFIAGAVRVAGKRDKPGVVPIARRALQWVAEYLGEGRRKRGPLVLSNRRHRITERTVHRILGKLARKARLPRTSPHTLRHSAASHLLASGMYLFDVQRFLRHFLSRHHPALPARRRTERTPRCGVRALSSAGHVIQATHSDARDARPRPGRTRSWRESRPTPSPPVPWVSRNGSERSERIY